MTRLTYPLVLQLGLVRFATSLLVVLLVNVLNRVLIVDLGAPATLVTFSFAFQHVMTPVGLVSGYCSDAHPVLGRHRTPYIWGGMLLSLAVIPFFPAWALALAGAPHSRGLLFEGILLFSLFGIGTTVSATAINALLVDQVPEADRGAALTLLWILTLGGFIVGSLAVSQVFPVFEAGSLGRVFGLTSIAALVLTVAGLCRVEPRGNRVAEPVSGQLSFRRSLAFLAGNAQSRAFFAFVVGSIFFLAIQTFLLAPFGGEVLGLPVAQTTEFGVYLTYGVLIGMVGLHSLLGLTRRRGVRTWLGLSLVVGGLAFGLLSLTAFFPHPAWGVYAIWVLGVCRGLYNVGLSHLTMRLAHPAFSGIFMGLWNLASGLALAGGEMVGGLLKDTLVPLAGGASGAYGGVFLLEGVGLLACLIFLAPLRRDEYHQHLAGLLAAPSLAASGDGSAGQGQGGSP